MTFVGYLFIHTSFWHFYRLISSSFFTTGNLVFSALAFLNLCKIV